MIANKSCVFNLQPQSQQYLCSSNMIFLWIFFWETIFIFLQISPRLIPRVSGKSWYWYWWKSPSVKVLEHDVINNADDDQKNVPLNDNIGALWSPFNDNMGILWGIYCNDTAEAAKGHKGIIHAFFILFPRFTYGWYHTFYHIDTDIWKVKNGDQCYTNRARIVNDNMISKSVFQKNLR